MWLPRDLKTSVSTIAGSETSVERDCQLALEGFASSIAAQPADITRRLKSSSFSLTMMRCLKPVKRRRIGGEAGKDGE